MPNYNVLYNNCEHFCSKCVHGVEQKSFEVRRYIANTLRKINNPITFWLAKIADN